jgi:LysR family transcriptional regulator, regulator of abg operon
LAESTSLKELAEAGWVTTSITAQAENELGGLFERYQLPKPHLAVQVQSALTLLTCLANSDLLAMAPTQWVDSPFTTQIIRKIEIKEELMPAALIVAKRSDSPLSPAADHMLDLMRRVASREA